MISEGKGGEVEVVGFGGGGRFNRDASKIIVCITI